VAPALAQLDRDRPETGIATLESVGRGYVGFAVRDPERFGIMFRLELLDRDDPDFLARRLGARDGGGGGLVPGPRLGLAVDQRAAERAHRRAGPGPAGRRGEPDVVQTLADSAGARPAGPH
jgi:hypothetical protein